MRQETTILLYKNITVFILSFCGVKKTDRQRETNTNCAYWPIISFSLDHTTLCFLQSQTWCYFSFSAEWYSTGGPLWAAAPVRRLVTRWRSRDRKVRLTQEWLSKTARISCGHLPYIISLHTNISVNHVDCFLWFSQVRPVQRISDWRLGQSSVCNRDSNSLTWTPQFRILTISPWGFFPTKGHTPYSHARSALDKYQDLTHKYKPWVNKRRVILFQNILVHH